MKMSPGQLAAIGIFTTATQAEVGVDVLITAGFKSTGISVLLPEQHNTKMASERAAAAGAPQPQGTKTATVTTIGATAGGALFGSLAVLAGAGALAIPGIGLLIAAGPLMAGLAGLGVGGALGGLGGALVGMGLQEDEAKRYVSHVGGGKTLVVVHCDTPQEVLKAEAALARAGAEDVSAGGENSAAVAAAVSP
jgi:hypothetical protein